MTAVWVQHSDRKPVERVAVALGPNSGVGPETLASLARGWEQTLGTQIEVGDERLIESSSADALVVDSTLASLLPATAARETVIVDFDGANALLDAGPHGAARIAGRGIAGYRWAVRHILALRAWPVDTYRYGREQDQRADLRLPDVATDAPHPVVVLVHGGGWKHRWTRDLMAPLAVDLAQGGYATWNVEFRRVGGGGGWPTTFDDLRLAINALPSVEDADLLDLSRVCFLGHSSGGQLALWSAGDPALAVRPAYVVAIAPVTDLVEASRRQLIGGEDIAANLLGGRPNEVPERYAAVSPQAVLPLGVSQLVVQGLSDYIPDLIDLSRSYVNAARAAGDDVEHVELAGVDHLGPLETTNAAWHLIRAKLASTLQRPFVSLGNQ